MPRSAVRNPIPRLVAASIARPWLTLAAGLVLVLLAGFFAADRFAITTDTAALISPQVPWRQQERRMEAAFPQLRDAMLIVVDGRTPELAEALKLLGLPTYGPSTAEYTESVTSYWSLTAQLVVCSHPRLIQSSSTDILTEHCFHDIHKS